MTSFPPEQTETLRQLVEEGGRTTLTITLLYDSQEIRDAVLKSPMEGGVSQGYERLAELLASVLAGEVK